MQDGTGELLNSGIVVLAMPRDATSTDTLLSGGLHWIRAAVHEKSDAVSRLQLVAAQAMKAVFVDRGNSPVIFSNAAAGRDDQQTRGARRRGQAYFPALCFLRRARRRTKPGFYTRVSERLRHKDRAINLWDYERLILEAFPQIYKAKCLKHTCYEPNESARHLSRTRAGACDHRYHPEPADAKPTRSPQALHQPGSVGEIKAFLKASGKLLRAIAREKPAIRGGARAFLAASPRRLRPVLLLHSAEAGDHALPVSVGLRRRPRRPSAARSTNPC